MNNAELSLVMAEQGGEMVPDILVCRRKKQDMDVPETEGKGRFSHQEDYSQFSSKFAYS